MVADGVYICDSVISLDGFRFIGATCARYIGYLEVDYLTMTTPSLARVSQQTKYNVAYKFHQLYLVILLISCGVVWYSGVCYVESLKLNITNIVNGTPDIILDKIDTHSLNGFTNYVKLFLLQTYQDTCTVPNCYICSLSNTLNT